MSAGSQIGVVVFGVVRLHVNYEGERLEKIRRGSMLRQRVVSVVVVLVFYACIACSSRKGRERDQWIIKIFQCPSCASRLCFTELSSHDSAHFATSSDKVLAFSLMSDSLSLISISLISI